MIGRRLSPLVYYGEETVIMDFDTYEGRLACYKDGQGGLACFIPKCPKCGRFVKAGDVWVSFDGEANLERPNAVCKKCGEVTMPFDGYWGDEDFA